jgi:hypothetical protein
MLPKIRPINPLRIKVPFDDPEFIAELKHDGLRALCYLESGTARLISRKEHSVQIKTICPARRVTGATAGARCDSGWRITSNFVAAPGQWRIVSVPETAEPSQAIIVVVERRKP